MPTSHQAFDAHLETWKREMATPWSRIRLKVEIANLLCHVGPSGLKVLDAGGANGYASIPFAQNGCQVVVADYSEAMLTDGQKLMSDFGSTARALGVDEMTKLLEGHGCVIQTDYGVRCMIDHWGDNARKAEPDTFAQLEQLEFALSAEYPYKLLARFFQVIAQKA